MGQLKMKNLGTQDFEAKKICNNANSNSNSNNK